MLTEPEKEAIMFLVRRRVDTILRHPHHREHNFTMLTAGPEQGLEERVLPLVQRVFDSQTHKFGRRWRVCRVQDGERKRGEPTPTTKPPQWQRQTTYTGDVSWMLERWPCDIDLLVSLREGWLWSVPIRHGGLLMVGSNAGLADLPSTWKAHIDKPDLWVGQRL